MKNIYTLLYNRRTLTSSIYSEFMFLAEIHATKIKPTRGPGWVLCKHSMEENCSIYLPLLRFQAAYGNSFISHTSWNHTYNESKLRKVRDTMTQKLYKSRIHAAVVEDLSFFLQTIILLCRHWSLWFRFGLEHSKRGRSGCQGYSAICKYSVK